MPIESHLNEALPFAGLALVLALIALFLRSPARQTMLVMLVVIAVGMIGLAVEERQLFGPSSRSLAVVVREASLALIALGVIQIVVLFLFQALLVRRRLPRILNEFVVALALIGYAIYRLDAVGVNLAGLITTSAVVSAMRSSKMRG